MTEATHAGDDGAVHDPACPAGRPDGRRDRRPARRSEPSRTRTETAISKIRLNDEEVWALLDERRVGVFTSLRRDGTPISLPVWYAPIRRRVYLHTPPQ